MRRIRNVFIQFWGKQKEIMRTTKYRKVGKMEEKSGRSLIWFCDQMIREQNLPSRLFVNGETVTEPTHVAKELNTFFAGIGGIISNSSRSPQKSYKHCLGSPWTKSMAVIPVTSTEVDLIMKTLKGTSASGFDRIHRKALKAVLPSIL